MAQEEVVDFPHAQAKVGQAERPLGWSLEPMAPSCAATCWHTMAGVKPPSSLI